jgi:hypothetical protein
MHASGNGNPALANLSPHYVIGFLFVGINFLEEQEYYGTSEKYTSDCWIKCF